MKAAPPAGGVLAWWRRVVRYALRGGHPDGPEEVPAWALCVPWRIWRLPKRPDGRSFEDAYAGRHPRIVRWLFPFRLLYLAFLFAFPLVAVMRGLPDRRAIRRALARPDLVLPFPRARPGDREVAWSRPDYAIGMFYAWEYALHRPPHHTLDDKRAFAAACARVGLPTPRTVEVVEAVARGGRWIAKERLSDRGVGVHDLSAAELAARPDAADLVIQERLRNHRGLLGLLPPDAPLSTLRVVTTLREPGRPPRVTRLAFRAGRAGHLTDNAAGGGLWAPVDPTTGRAGPALTRATFLERRDGRPVRTTVHPDTGRPFAGLRIPRLAEARDLAVRAHALLAPEAVSLGWDVALTDRGPVLLEVNLWAASYDDTPSDDAFRPVCERIVERIRRLTGPPEPPRAA